MSFFAPHRTVVRSVLPSVAVVLGVLASRPGLAQELTTPEAFFGHQIGADYELPDYGDLSRYWETLAAESPRMTLQSIGTTAEGRDQLMAIVTSPENHANLDEYREISARLALARGVSEEEARALARRGKAVVWIDGGLHATEVLGAQQLMETLWQFVSGTDDETMRILDDVIILFVHANPDGMDLVSNWYTRIEEKTERSTRGIPVLYQKYVGHDNNRDFYTSFQPESENMNRQMYRTWYPADRLQPPPDRAHGNRPLRASVPRPLQLQHRPDGHHRNRSGRDRRCTRASRRRGSRGRRGGAGPTTPRGGTVASARRPTSRT